jgi:hypothetical protein
VSDALASLYGKKSALTGNVGGQARVQEVHTPAWIWQAVRDTFGGRIALDPCAASDPQHWQAEANITLPDNALALDWDVDGGIYANPPFNQLGPTKGRPATEKSEAKPFTHCGWMAKFATEAEAGRQIVALVPFRPHRKFFLKACSGGEIVCLNYDVKFEGHKQAFPAPLCLISWNCRVVDLCSRENGRWRP